LNQGLWVHERPERPKRGYQINALYLPLGWDSWSVIAKEFLEAKGNPQSLKTWVNTRLAEPFESAGDQPDWAKLRARGEPYEIFTCPEQAFMLVAAADVQANRIEVKIKAYGPREESWLVWTGQLYGDTQGNEPWLQLDGLLERKFPARPDGSDGRHIACLGIDAGFRTQEVYNFVRHRGPRVFALKGASQPNRPVLGRPSSQDISWRGETIKGGVQLWPIGTDTAKATIYGRLQISEPGPGYMHFPIGLPDEYFRQLTAERRVDKFVRGYPVPEWVKIYERNEALDLEVYCYAAALRAGLSALDRPQGGVKPQAQAQKQAAPRDLRRERGERPGWLNR